MLSTHYFLPTALLKQTISLTRSLYAVTYSSFRSSAQPAVLIWIALVASKGFKVKWDLLEPSQGRQGEKELRNTSAYCDKGTLWNIIRSSSDRVQGDVLPSSSHYKK